MKNIDDTDASAPTGNPAPGFVPAVKKKLIDNKWFIVAVIAVIAVIVYFAKR
jgi:hypothetical protein